MAAICKRSQLQRKILRLLLHRGWTDLSAIVKDCSGGIEYCCGKKPRFQLPGEPRGDDKHRKYQAAYASISRSLRRLEDEGLVKREWWRPATEADRDACDFHPANEAYTTRGGISYPAAPDRVLGRYVVLTDAGKQKGEIDEEFTFIRPKVGNEPRLKVLNHGTGLTAASPRLKVRAGRRALTAARRRLKVSHRGTGLTSVRRRSKKASAA